MAGVGAERQRGATGIALRDPLPWHELEQIVATSEQTGYAAVFLPEVAARDVFAALTGLAPAAPTLTLATGVSTIVSRTPRVTAMAAATVAERSGGRMLLGLGTGPSRKGALDALRSYVTTARDLLDGAEVDGERLTLDIPRPVPIWIAALGPRAMRLAGEIADGVLLNWCPPERVAFGRERIREGAEAARRDPADVHVGVYVRSVVGQGARGDAGLRKAAAEYASYPAYRRQFEDVGLATEAERAAAGDVPDALLDAIALRGDAATASRRLQAYRDAGADLPVVYPVAALEPVSSILGTLFALAPAPAVED
jgi:alkanesulfonate monooxygenase SsuD/methylene tetrahydromethanopterin reductase-like flavin-dependent oxidoreductase (luciferase family)